MCKDNKPNPIELMYVNIEIFFLENNTTCKIDGKKNVIATYKKSKQIFIGKIWTLSFKKMYIIRYIKLIVPERKRTTRTCKQVPNNNFGKVSNFWLIFSSIRQL